jgi:hypothetical protein
MLLGAAACLVDPAACVPAAALTPRPAAQANRSWVVKMSEWALEPLAGNVRGLRGSAYKVGLNTRRAAAHIVVYDRYKQCLEEELISPVVVLAMRNMYQSTFGALMKGAGIFRYLQVRAGRPR